MTFVFDSINGLAWIHDGIMWVMPKIGHELVQSINYWFIWSCHVPAYLHDAVSKIHFGPLRHILQGTSPFA
eukprot:6627615-Ditylum_brightwellii.AAC.1